MIKKKAVTRQNPRRLGGEETGVLVVAMAECSILAGCGKALVLGGAALQRCVQGLYFQCGLQPLRYFNLIFPQPGVAARKTNGQGCGSALVSD